MSLKKLRKKLRKEFEAMRSEMGVPRRKPSKKKIRKKLRKKYRDVPPVHRSDRPDMTDKEFEAAQWVLFGWLFTDPRAEG